MGQLPTYGDFSEKRESFSRNNDFFQIDTIYQFNSWYRLLTKTLGEKTDNTKIASVNTNFMFRGLSEAKFKLITSAQRFWIENEVRQWWEPKSYLEFVNEFIEVARDKKLFNKVFKYYNIQPTQRDFPILSILQHYGAPTPLLDWTYSLDVALYFATLNAKPSNSSNTIDHYFSIYFIDKSKQPENEFNNLIKWSESFPRLSTFYEWEKNKNSVFYISDFESKGNTKSFRDERPITTFYNQNIIPQEGLFIFNPFPDKPLEDCFNTNHFEEGNNLNLLPFHCINVKKDLGEYIRRRIKHRKVDKYFIYPDLKMFCSNLIEEFLDDSTK